MISTEMTPRCSRQRREGGRRIAVRPRHEETTMPKYCYIDLQTASSGDLKKFGSGHYGGHETTRVLFMTYSFDFDVIKQYSPVELDTFPESVETFLNDAAGQVCLWYAPFTEDILRMTLGLQVRAEVKNLSSMSKSQGWAHRFMDFYSTHPISPRPYSFVPYSRSEVDISEYIQKFSVGRADPDEYPDEWGAYKVACRKRVWAYREIHRGILTGDYLKKAREETLLEGQDLLDSVI